MISRRTFLAGAAAVAGHNLVPAAPKTPVAAAVATLCPVTPELWAQKTPDEILADIRALFVAQLAAAYQVPERMLVGQPRMPDLLGEADDVFTYSA